MIAGLSNGMTLQRNLDNVSETVVYVETQAQSDFDIKADHRMALEVLSKEKTPNGSYVYALMISGLPTGGSYSIQLISKDSSSSMTEEMEFKDILVGDIWILAGQSNMEGIGWMDGALPPKEQIRSLNHHDEWVIAQDPLHRLYDAHYPIHVVYTGGKENAKHFGVGPGLSFVNEMNAIYGIPQGLIPCAHGGTSMEQWSPDKKRLERNSLYGAMCERFKLAGSRISGLLWYQGCSDTGENEVKIYKESMHKLIKHFRTDLLNPQLPVVIVQIGRVAGGATSPTTTWNQIQQYQLDLQIEIDHLRTVAAIDLDLDDTIHISGKDQIRLGKRMCLAMQSMTDSAKNRNPPLSLDSIRCYANPLSGMMDVEVKFKNVNGKLTSQGRAGGFEIRGENPMLDEFRVCKIELQGDKAILRTMLNDVQSPLYLHYGLGIMPYCNIVDERDMAVPVFGPIPLPEKEK